MKICVCSVSVLCLFLFRFEKSDLQKTIRLSKVFVKKLGQVVEKSFESVLCLFGFVKETKFRDSSEYSDYVQNV